MMTARINGRSMERLAMSRHEHVHAYVTTAAKPAVFGALPTAIPASAAIWMALFWTMHSLI